MKKLMLLPIGLALAGLVSVAVPSLAGATAPTPGSFSPDSGQGCSGDACIYLSTPSGGTVYVLAWPYNVSFYGHFELTVPSGTQYNTAAKTWTPGTSDEYEWSNLTASVGQYCVTAWSGTTSLGTACESVE